MKVLVCGSNGCIGSAVVRALRSRGHQVVEGSRQPGAAGLQVDFMQAVTPERWAGQLQTRQIDAVVNCIGMLLPRASQRFERVHAEGPIELFQGAALAGVARVVQVSAPGSGTSPYLRSKHAADAALLALPLQATVLRPALVYGPGCASTRLFATLAALPVVTLPGGGRQTLQPIHVYEVAEIIVRCLERSEPARGVFEIAGGETADYRGMLAAYRHAQRLGDALWLPLPMALMRASAWLAEALPQQVFCRETLAMLATGSVPAHNAAAALLGRAPTGLAAGLAISPPEPWLSLRAELSPALERLLRTALTLMWLWLAAASLPDPLAFALGTTFGVLTLWRPGPRLYALQGLVLLGYGVIALWQLPLLLAVLLLWLAAPPATPTRRATLTPNA